MKKYLIPGSGMGCGNRAGDSSSHLMVLLTRVSTGIAGGLGIIWKFNVISQSIVRENILGHLHILHRVAFSQGHSAALGMAPAKAGESFSFSPCTCLPLGRNRELLCAPSPARAAPHRVFPANKGSCGGALHCPSEWEEFLRNWDHPPKGSSCKARPQFGGRCQPRSFLRLQPLQLCF